MSSPDRLSRSGALLLALALIAPGLAACGADVHPLYGSFGGTGSETVTFMRHVDIAAISGRVGQQVRNELVFGFYGGAGEPLSPRRWQLDITVSSTENSVGVERSRNLPSAYIEHLTATWTLTENATGKTVTSGVSFAQAAYDYSEQRFADVRAKRDAENRAATVIAGDIRNKVAVFFATHQP